MPKGQLAAWWREHTMRLSRPALGEILGIDARTIERYEAKTTVPSLYRLACAALTQGLESWEWQGLLSRAHKMERAQLAYEVALSEERLAFERMKSLLVNDEQERTNYDLAAREWNLAKAKLGFIEQLKEDLSLGGLATAPERQGPPNRRPATRLGPTIRLGKKSPRRKTK